MGGDPIEAIREAKRIRNEFEGESKRATVIIGAARINTLLGHLLKSYLVPAPKAEDRLFEGRGPLSTFSSRINLAHRLALIDREMARTIHLIRKTRNAFAHEVSPGTFDEGSHANRLKHIYEPVKGANIIDGSDTEETSQFSKFTITLEICLTTLEIGTRAVKTLKLPDEPFSLDLIADIDLGKSSDE